MPKVVASVLHYKNEKITNRCVDSIQKTAPEVHILVIDNNSPEVYTRKDVTVIRNDSHWSVDGMNRGFLEALKLDPTYIINFDNDIICLDEWLDPLVKVMDADPRIGITGGKQWTEDQKEFRCVGMDLIGGALYRNLPEKQCNVVWIQGSFVMIRADMMTRIGIHDDRFRIICSDSDYCIHAIDRGYKVVFVPESNVIHVGNASYGNKPCVTWQDDSERLIQKWSGIKGMSLLKDLPLIWRENTFMKADFEIVKKEGDEVSNS